MREKVSLQFRWLHELRSKWIEVVGAASRSRATLIFTSPTSISWCVQQAQAEHPAQTILMTASKPMPWPAYKKSGVWKTRGGDLYGKLAPQKHCWQLTQQNFAPLELKPRDLCKDMNKLVMNRVRCHKARLRSRRGWVSFVLLYSD